MSDSPSTENFTNQDSKEPPKKLRLELDELIKVRKFLTTQLDSERIKLRQFRKELEHAKLAQTYLQEIAQQVQQGIHRQIAKIVSRCLTAVFERPYELRIEFERKRGKTEAVFHYLKDGYPVNPRTSSGGVLDVAAFALRLTAMILTLPPGRRFLALDEPFKGLSETNLPKMGKMIKTLSTELDVQFLIATHDKALEVGKTIQL
jgi:DNA repair exonuclease SbcCD ATPase subunit